MTYSVSQKQFYHLLKILSHGICSYSDSDGTYVMRKPIPIAIEAHLQEKGLSSTSSSLGKAMVPGPNPGQGLPSFAKEAGKEGLFKYKA